MSTSAAPLPLRLGRRRARPGRPRPARHARADPGARPGRPSDRRRGRAGPQRGGGPRAERPPAARLPHDATSPSPPASRSPTTPAPTARGQSPAACATTLDGVEAVRLEAKGRGRALRAAWEASDAAVLAYMDVDLSTDLAGLLPLVAPLVSGHSDLAIGSRRAHGSRVVRGPKREIISRGYNLLLHATLRTRFSDAQCGFKAIRADVAREVLPLMQDGAWFFDTEMLVIAERAGHAHPRGAGGLGRRPRQPRRHRGDRARGPARHRAGAPRPGARDAGRAARGAAPDHAPPRRPGAADGALRGHRGAEHPRLRRHLPAAARRRHGRAGRQRPRAGGHGRRQHGRQPAR